MITAGDFRKGVTFEMDGNIYLVVDFLHVKPGKGSPFVRAKIKNIVTGQVLERTFNPSDKFQVAVIERKEMQYLYNEGDLYYFMDMETYDQIPLNKSQVEDAMNFMKENMNATIQFYKGSAFSVVPPTFVELEVTETEPGVWTETIVPREYYGDLNRNIRHISSNDKVNEDISVNNELSIVSDPYAMENFYQMRYAEFMGVKWKVSSVEVRYPRLILSLGGVYNA